MTWYRLSGRACAGCAVVHKAVALGWLVALCCGLIHYNAGYKKWCSRQPPDRWE